ncbi:uncharacterized protein (TIGR02598 family) [Prosthecobacter fusiformis]|uniref:Uncharacterized protein (TIGR02598 family) n=1 Tax=Prosthecobacter fusiformis TaxID=48464 RepID=A0A4R7SRZ5_9BACT|nr:Verru_Chthon cassette protein B [Prosthecobacter fusiformis]TDU81495.1 uncharacterized protein (TIGR02598 family) [Prosthecobacter fusiformis]
MKISPTSLRSRRSGFSLAEVTIATGITALAMTTLLGLIPEGLNNIRQAGDLAAETQITNHLFGAVTQAKWHNAVGEDLLAPAFDQQRYFFDDQGVAIEAENPGMDLAYIAEVSVPPADVPLTADSTATNEDYDPYLRRVTVRVTNAANPNFDFDRALPVTYRTHTTLIARTGK